MLQVEASPLYCIHQGPKVDEDSNDSRNSPKKNHLHLDWFSSDSTDWCLRLSSMKLTPAKLGGNCFIVLSLVVSNYLVCFVP